MVQQALEKLHVRPWHIEEGFTSHSGMGLRHLHHQHVFRFPSIRHGSLSGHIVMFARAQHSGC